MASTEQDPRVTALHPKVKLLNREELAEFVRSHIQDLEILAIDKQLMEIKISALTRRKLLHLVKNKVETKEIHRIDEEVKRLFPQCEALTKDVLADNLVIGLEDKQQSKMNNQAKQVLDDRKGKLTLKVLQPIKTERESLKLLLLGSTGAGKSSSANLITGTTSFVESHHSESCTQTISVGECEFEGLKLTVIDTPGFNDTDPTKVNSQLTEMAKVVEICRDGIDGILFLFNAANPRFTTEQKAAFEELKTGVGLLGKEFMNNVFIVLTHGYSLVQKQSVAEYVGKEVEDQTIFGQILKGIEKRIIAIDTGEETAYGTKIQREQLIRLLAANTSVPCTPAVFGKFLAHRMKIADKLPKGLRPLAPKIETLIMTRLRDQPRETILSDEIKDNIICDVVNCIHELKTLKDEGDIVELYAAVKSLYDGVKDRVTKPTFLQMIADFMAPLFKAIGNIFKRSPRAGKGK